MFTHYALKLNKKNVHENINKETKIFKKSQSFWESFVLNQKEKKNKDSKALITVKIEIALLNNKDGHNRNKSTTETFIFARLCE